MTREVGVATVYVGLRRARERGNVCVCVCVAEIWKECLSVRVCFTVFVFYLFVNAHSDTPPPVARSVL